MHGLNWKVTTLSLGLYGAVTFTLCVLYGLVAPASLHASQLLEAVLPGFRWLSLGSFVLGLVESFIFGVYAATVFTLLYNWVLRWVEVPEERRADPMRTAA